MFSDFEGHLVAISEKDERLNGVYKIGAVNNCSN